MRQLAERVLRYTTLTLITVAAIGVMWLVSRRHTDDENGPRGTSVAEVPAVALPKALVAVEYLEPEICEITATFSGKIRPWETYTLAFEVAGRVQELGTDEAGRPLDDGSTVTAGQVLAQLDDRIYRARKSEAAAQLEEATTDMNRIRGLREINPAAVTDTELQEQLTELALARAQHEVALKNLDDSTLLSPVDATISRRLINAGESVMANQAAFELVQNDEVLLVVDVPESQVFDLQERRRAVLSQAMDSTADPAERIFRAYVTLEGHDRYGRRRPPIEAQVYRIAQVADARTGLFEVEIRIPNEDYSLRSGMVATARIVIDRISGYRVPEAAVIFRDRMAYLFEVETIPAPMQVMFWNAGDTEVHEVQRIDLAEWIDQGPTIIVPSDKLHLAGVVVRGQQRLSDGQLVRIAQPEEELPPEEDEPDRVADLLPAESLYTPAP